MKTWNKESIRARINHPERLLEKRMCFIKNSQQYINAYEYSLFTTVNFCHMLSSCMHSSGFIFKDVVTPFIAELAIISDNVHNYAALAKIKWNKKTFAGILRRPDCIQLLHRCDYDVNGFEFGITFMPRSVGTLIFRYKLCIANVIRYEKFKKCKGIKYLFIQ